MNHDIKNCEKCGQWWCPECPDTRKCKHAEIPTLDLSKPLRTTKGKKARLVSREGDPKFNLVMMVENPPDWRYPEHTGLYDEFGNCVTGSHDEKIINVPSPAPITFRFERWVAVDESSYCLMNRLFMSQEDCLESMPSYKPLKVLIEGELCP